MAMSNSSSRLIDWTVEGLLGRTTKRGGCSIWPRINKKTGYAVGGEQGIRVSRFMCRLVHGEPPTEQHEACHTCDDRACIEPQHLFWGTRKENAEDMARKGRAAKGEQHGNSKLTAEQVAEIRKLGYLPSTAVARMFSVSKKTILDIRHGRTWRES